MRIKRSWVSRKEVECELLLLLSSRKDGRWLRRGMGGRGPVDQEDSGGEEKRGTGSLMGLWMERRTKAVFNEVQEGICCGKQCPDWLP